MNKPGSRHGTRDLTAQNVVALPETGNGPDAVLPDAVAQGHPAVKRVPVGGNDQDQAPGSGDAAPSHTDDLAAATVAVTTAPLLYADAGTETQIDNTRGGAVLIDDTAGTAAAAPYTPPTPVPAGFTMSAGAWGAIGGGVLLLGAAGGGGGGGGGGGSGATPTVPAAPTINTIAGDDVINASETSPAITGTADANTQISLTLIADSGEIVRYSTSANGSGNWSVTLSAGDIATLGQGNVTITATAANSIGNSSTTTHTIDIDTIIAATTIDTIAGNDVINANETASTITGTCDYGAAVALSIGGNTRTATVTGGSWSYTLTPADITAMGQGAETIGATATDSAGNTSTATRAISVNTTIVSTDIYEVAGDNIINASERAGTVVIAGDSANNATVVLTLGTGNTHTVTAAGNNGYWSYTLTAADYTALGQGTQTIRAVGTDTAGNTSSGTLNLTIDTVAPSAPTLALATDSGSSNTDHITNVGTINVSGLESGATWQYQVDGGTWQTGTGSSFTASTGTHTYAVYQTDLAGNTGAASSSLTVNLDTTAPSAPTLALATDSGSSNTDHITNVGTINVSGLASGTTWQYQVDGGTWQTGTGSSFTASTGTHTYAVHQTDTAGNISAASSSLSVTLDTTATTPTLSLATDSGSSNTDHITNVGTVNVSGLESGATWQYQVDGGTWQTGTGSSFNATAGSHGYAVRQTDLAGNTSTASSSFTVDLETTATAPTLALATDSGSSNTDGVTNVGTVNVSGLESGATWQYQVDGGTWQTGTGSSFTASTGTHTYVVHQTDTAGNTGAASSSLTVDLDTTVPTVSSVAITDATGALNHYLNAGDVVTATVSMSEAVNVTGTPQLALDIGGTPVEASYASGSGTGTLTFNYTIQAGQTDANGIGIDANSLSLNGGTIADLAGNTATLTHSAVADNANYMVDTTAPAAPTLALATDSGSSNTDGVTNVGTVNVSGLESGATWQYQVDNGTWQTGTGSSFTASTGTHTYAVHQTDTAGNTGAASSSLTVDLDTTAPTVTISDVLGSNPATGNFTLTFSFSEVVSNFVASDVTLQHATSVGDVATADGGKTYTLVVTPAITSGTVTVDVAAGVTHDIAGNANTAATQFTQLVNIPVI